MATGQGSNQIPMGLNNHKPCIYNQAFSKFYILLSKCYDTQFDYNQTMKKSVTDSIPLSLVSIFSNLFLALKLNTDD